MSKLLSALVLITWSLSCSKKNLQLTNSKVNGIKDPTTGDTSSEINYSGALMIESIKSEMLALRYSLDQISTVINSAKTEVSLVSSLSIENTNGLPLDGAGKSLSLASIAVANGAVRALKGTALPEDAGILFQLANSEKPEQLSMATIIKGQTKGMGLVKAGGKMEGLSSSVMAEATAEMSSSALRAGTKSGMITSDNAPTMISAIANSLFSNLKNTTLELDADKIIPSFSSSLSGLKAMILPKEALILVTQTMVKESIAGIETNNLEAKTASLLPSIISNTMVGTFSVSANTENFASAAAEIGKSALSSVNQLGLITSKSDGSTFASIVFSSTMKSMDKIPDWNVEQITDIAMAMRQKAMESALDLGFSGNDAADILVDATVSMVTSMGALDRMQDLAVENDTLTESFNRVTEATTKDLTSTISGVNKDYTSAMQSAVVSAATEGSATATETASKDPTKLPDTSPSQTLPSIVASPTLISRTAPAVQRSTSNSLTFLIGNATPGHTIKFYSDNLCSNILGQGVYLNAATPVALTLTTPGPYNFFARAFDTNLKSSDCVFTGQTYTFDLETSVVKVTSASPSNVTLNGIIDIAVEFSEAVVVTGAPNLELELGTTARFATYSSGSGTDTLIFRYIVSLGDFTTDLDYKNSAALSLNSGSIKNTLVSNANLTLPSPGLTNSLSFNQNIMVDAIPPVISNVSDIGTSEDTPVNSLGFTITDNRSLLTCSSSVTASSSNTTLLPVANIMILGAAPNCTVSLNPAANFNGTATVTLTVTDSQLTAEDTFVLTVNAVNDAPTISDVPNLTSMQNTSLIGIGVNISDLDSSLVCATSLSATSSNQTLLLDANITITGTAPNCTVSLTPASNQFGISTVTLTVSDSMITAQDTFDFVVFEGWKQEAYIKASNAQASDYFGVSVALSRETLVVGALLEASSQTTITNGTTSSADNLASGAGASYIYKRSGTTWAQEAYLKASNANNSDSFAHTVDLSGDTVVIGAYQEDSNQATITNGTTSSSDNSVSSSGASYIYKRTGSTWVQEAYIKASNAKPNDFFGLKVALSGDSAVIGATKEDSNATTITNGTTASTNTSAADAGASYIYKRTGSSWTQEAYLKSSNAGPNDSFGYAIDISGDTVVIGALLEDSNQSTITNGTTSSIDNLAPESGASYIYRKIGSSWVQEAYLKASNADSNDYFGNSVSLSGDTVIIGAYLESSNQTSITNGTTSSTDNSTPQSGASFIYRRTGTTWVQEAYLKATNANATDYFGYSVALSGNTAVMGTYQEDSNQSTITNATASSSDNSTPNAGASYIFKRTGSTWVQEAYLKASNPDSNEYFGKSVSISGDTVSVGANGEKSNQSTITNGTTASPDNSATLAGAVYVYRSLARMFDPDVFVSSKTATSITFQWGSSLGSTATIRVALAENGLAAPAVGCIGGTDLSPGATSYTYSGLTPAAKYGFRFCTIDGPNVSDGTTIWESTD